MIDWWGVFANLLWIAGLATLLAAASAARYRAVQAGIPLRQALAAPAFRAALLVSLLLALGIATALVDRPARPGPPAPALATTPAVPPEASVTAPAPTSAAPATRTSGGRSGRVPASVIDIQLRNDKAIKACFAAHQQATGELPPVTVRFTLAPSGSASAVSLEEAGYQGTPLASCLAESVQRIAFPAFEGDPASFSFTFPF